MKVLLDECVDRRLARELVGHEVRTVPDMGWAGLHNGELLALAQKEFEIFLTVDRNLSFQQPLPLFSLAVVVVRAASNRLQDLMTFLPEILEVLPKARRGEVTWLGSQGGG